MSRFRTCLTSGCKHQVRVGLQPKHYAGVSGQPLADGEFCWRCRAKHATKESRAKAKVEVARRDALLKKIRDGKKPLASRGYIVPGYHVAEVVGVTPAGTAIMQVRGGPSDGAVVQTKLRRS